MRARGVPPGQYGNERIEKTGDRPRFPKTVVCPLLSAAHPAGLGCLPPKPTGEPTLTYSTIRPIKLGGLVKSADTEGHRKRAFLDPGSQINTPQRVQISPACRRGGQRSMKRSKILTTRKTGDRPRFPVSNQSSAAAAPTFQE